MKPNFKPSAIVLNTFDFFEQAVLDALSVLLPPIYTIGPLPLLTRQIADGKLNFDLSLWKEKFDTVEWLDSKELGAVLPDFAGDSAVLAPEFLTETKDRGNHP
ncbi:hypothetical protein Patl1_27234 [Pistacia atlantica]|uniref:Uncharacterized protein n=1 Tax=Pistacia atlantica TaxID=434234 RepID=A0ACC1BCV3_9ROSI|nr:hypothetical protein Patl1_27234 [Pistacia atlantica]